VQVQEIATFQVEKQRLLQEMSVLQVKKDQAHLQCVQLEQKNEHLAAKQNEHIQRQPLRLTTAPVPMATVLEGPRRLPYMPTEAQQANVMATKGGAPAMPRYRVPVPVKVSRESPSVHMVTPHSTAWPQQVRETAVASAAPQQRVVTSLHGTLGTAPQLSAQPLQLHSPPRAWSSFG